MPEYRSTDREIFVRYLCLLAQAGSESARRLATALDIDWRLGQPLVPEQTASDG